VSVKHTGSLEGERPKVARGNVEKVADIVGTIICIVAGVLLAWPLASNFLSF